jgi:hypothetical protein
MILEACRASPAMNNPMTARASLKSVDMKQAHSPAARGQGGLNALSVLAGVEMTPRTVGEALNSLELVAARLRAKGDARAVFPDVYAVITRRVKLTIESGNGPAFLEPEWISNLAGLFCQHYLRALEASLSSQPQAGAAWDVAFERSDARGAMASVDALLGINAHINFDLAQGLYDNIVAHNAVNDPRLLARYRHDHDLVNSILQASMPEIFAILSGRYGCPLARVATSSMGVEDAVGRAVLFALRQWRDRDWRDLVEMLEAKDQRGIDAVLARMDRSSGRIGRAIAFGSQVLAVACPWAQDQARAWTLVRSARPATNVRSLASARAKKAQAARSLPLAA